MVLKMIENRWYVACSSLQLTSERPVAARVGDKKLALFRDESGRPCALLDRCCHRGFPLSRGAITAGRLQCGYHGWEYDSGGRCVRIPSQSADRSIPSRYGVPPFSCREQDGYVWVWIGVEQPSELAGIPQVGDGYWVQGCRVLRCHYLRALEIAFDMSHIYFVHPLHPATVRARQFGFVQETYEVRTTDDGCVVFCPATAEEREAIPRRATIMEFRLPGTVHFTYPVGSQLSHMFFFVTPLSASSCRLDWMLPDAPSTSSNRIRWEGEGGMIADEDQATVELIQPAYDEEGESFECSVEADMPTLTLRKVVKEAEANGGKRDPSVVAHRRLISAATAGRK